MKACLALLTILLLADAALTLHATESLGLLVAVVSWVLLYGLLGSALSKWRQGLRWLILFAGLGIGFGIDVITDRSFHWFTGIAAVAAAGHYAGWTGALGLVAGDSKRARHPNPLGRPGCFNTSFVASILLAYLCQTDASELETRIGLIAGFLVVILGFITWELGRTEKGRNVTTERMKRVGAGAILRWLIAGAAGFALFFLFAQVLPLAADQATQATKLQLTADSFNLPDLPDLDSTSLQNDPFRKPKPKQVANSTGSPPIESLEGLSGGFSQDVAGGTPENAPRLQEFDDGDASGNLTSPASLIAENRTALETEDSPASSENARASSGLETASTGSSFWSLPPALVWPFLILAALVGVAVAVILVLLRSGSDSRDGKAGEDTKGRPHWDHEFVPGYLRDFLAQAAELGMEKERGVTLREFLRKLRRKGITHRELPELRDYHYRVQFEHARRNDSAERKFRRNARKWLQR